MILQQRVWYEHYCMISMYPLGQDQGQQHESDQLCRLNDLMGTLHREAIYWGVGGINCIVLMYICRTTILITPQHVANQ